ncbi:VOC family protein [Paenibacillus yanchengensis]|uniref:VOC family protein n=1 Tax=Paenibacillus yanchengensis TaxID=2035833 RepID=A0ABW4YGZ3_9BACL
MTAVLHPNIRLGEVKLKVSDLERSITFYEEVIGLKLLRREGELAYLTVDGQNALVILQQVADAIIVPERSMSGLYHFAILLPTREALAVTLQHLVNKGISVGQADHIVSEALYLADPDGNGIEIYRDRPREEWEYDTQGNVNMVTIPIDWKGLLQLAQGKEWTGMPAQTVIGHVHFHASNITESGRFYTEVIGFTVEADFLNRMGALFLAAGGYHHHLGLNIWAGRNAPITPPNGTGIAYFSIIVPDEAELEKIAARLEADGAHLEREAQSIFTYDPNRIGILIYVAK